MAAKTSRHADRSHHNIGHLIKVGQYELSKTIGKGNFAVVKLATHTITKSQVGEPSLGLWRRQETQGHVSHFTCLGILFGDLSS